jgi:SAM-dependent methyltransferase
VGSAAHWDSIYRSRATEDLGWYEPRPSTLDLVLRFSRPSDSVIDVGSGDGRMVDDLLAGGYESITALDLSAAALDRARSRLGPAARNVTWVHADVTTWTPERQWDVWHDRAVFHFLIGAGDREAYKRAALRSLAPGGRLIVATFAQDGPERCAGLPVERYDVGGLAGVFGPEFRLVEDRALRRTTGAGDARPYVAAVFERR